ncbi:MAG: hypothetical protein Q7R47_06685 [Candidatus Diapherotrites archaeon]|nr:hypothetical protein [Candidatus Diapherotrites archaeon]
MIMAGHPMRKPMRRPELRKKVFVIRDQRYMDVEDKFTRNFSEKENLAHAKKLQAALGQQHPDYAALDESARYLTKMVKQKKAVNQALEKMLITHKITSPLLLGALGTAKKVVDQTNSILRNYWGKKAVDNN